MQTVPSDDAQEMGVSDDAEQTRTYQVRRRKADGVAFARLLAGKYGLTKEQLKGRLRK